jgi:hypothetical protein
MALIVPITATPNQSISVQLGGFFYIILLQSIGDTMAATITRDSVLLMSGLRISVNAPLIPFAFLGDDNFILTSNGSELPNYLSLGVSQFLAYLSADELASFR